LGLVAGLVVIVVASVLVVAAQRRSTPVSRLVIVTAPPGGVFEAYGAGLGEAARQEYPRADVRVVPTAGSVQNLQLVADGSADAGFTLADAAGAAVLGQAPFNKPLPVTALARLYDNYAHLVVRADARIERLGDLRGKIVSTGPPGSGTELFSDRLLAVAGLSVEHDVDRRGLAVQEAAAALQRGQVDAFFISSGLPTAAVADLAANTPIRLVPLAEWVPKLRASYGEFYEERTILASTYELSTDTQTIGVPNLLVVSSAMSDDSAHALTDLLFSSKPALVQVHPEAARLNRQAAFATYPLPLHPGAARWYREYKP
jgi:TRAP transporter TAXI family solute receptor